MVYKKDIEDVNWSMAQCSNNSIIPYKGLDVKRTCADYDGAGPNGEGSSSTTPKMDCEESIEYKDCGEELSNWEESSESDREG